MNMFSSVCIHSHYTAVLLLFVLFVQDMVFNQYDIDLSQYLSICGPGISLLLKTDSWIVMIFYTLYYNTD